MGLRYGWDKLTTMKIINPTTSKIEVIIHGNNYSIEPLGVLTNVPPEDALYWKTNLHLFMEVYNDDIIEDVKVEAKVVKESPVVEETIKEVKSTKTK